TARSWARRGFTLVELLATVVIISVLSGLAVLKSKATIEQAKVAKAIGDIRTLQAEVQAYESGGQPLPTNLAAIGRDGLMDPWGRPYQYLPFDPTKPVPPGARRDVFMVPINSTFDVYSMGADGKSNPPLTSGPSQDDIVRGNDGGFIGLARKF
ncbi:MAG: prepilin-type N-terminal cleavage/methylation domain-containing protein, partial [Gemmatimonadales bacterium]